MKTSVVEREWRRQIRMDDKVVRTVTKKWPSLALPGYGKPVWK